MIRSSNIIRQVFCRAVGWCLRNGCRREAQPAGCALRTKLICWMAVLASAVLGPLRTPNVAAQDKPTPIASQINAANAMVRNGQFEEAVKCYESIQPHPSHNELLDFNMAVAQYKAGEIEAARSQFQSLSGSANPSIAASSRFNLGDCSFANAIHVLKKDRSAAIDLLNEAIDSFRSALHIDPAFADARTNLELALRLRNELQQQERPPRDPPQDLNPQDQQPQDQHQDPQQDQQQASDQQRSESQEEDGKQGDPASESTQDGDTSPARDESQKEASEADSAKDSQNGEDPQTNSDADSDVDSESGEQSSPRQNDGDPTKEGQQSPGESKMPTEESDPSSAGDAPMQSGDGANAFGEAADDPNSPQPLDSNSQHLNQREPGVPEEPELEDLDQESHVPSGQLTTAKGDPNVGAGKTQVADRGMLPTDEEGAMTREEALKLLQSVRDRDMVRRLRLQQRQRSRRRRVERDW